MTKFILAFTMVWAQPNNEFTSTEKLLVECEKTQQLGQVRLTQVKSQSFLSYLLRTKSFKIKMSALTGPELMGQEGKYIIFFEFLGKSHYMISFLDTDTMKYLPESTRLVCHKNQNDK